MTLTEIAFLVALGGAFVSFITVMAWVAHITKDIGNNRPADAISQSAVSEQAPQLDRAA